MRDERTIKLLEKSETMEFTDTFADIFEKAVDDDFARGLLVEDLFNFPSEKVKNEVRNVLNEMLKTKNKYLYICGHRGCNVKSCYSHEITENVFLKYLADSKSMVNELKRDFKENALRYTFKPTHKRNATNFPGYCSEHDRSLFEDIEAPFSGFSERFYNKYCLRLTRRELFELDRKLKIIEDLLSRTENLKSEDALLFRDSIRRKQKINIKRKDRALQLYDGILNGLDAGSYYIEFSEFNVRQAGYCFSTMLDLTMEEDEQYAIVFIIKLEYEKQSNFAIASIKNEVSKSLALELQPTENITLFHLSEIMCNKKDRLVFSPKFSTEIDESTFEVITRDNETFNLSMIDKLLLSQVFF